MLTEMTAEDRAAALGGMSPEERAAALSAMGPEDRAAATAAMERAKREQRKEEERAKILATKQAQVGVLTDQGIRRNTCGRVCGVRSSKSGMRWGSCMGFVKLVLE